ncbi:MAG: sigma-70 family RNA polymerase sigma factor [Nitrospirae bacterium]|nr:sigma-70 family RNA polymerase sigma factor [Nitrospirota bacterium]
MTAGELEFQNIYETYQPRIHRYLTRLVGPFEAEDLTQEVFVKVNWALKSFRGESQLSTWIYRIATNTALDRLRSPSFQQKDSVSEEAPDAEDKDVWTGEKTPPVDQKLIRKEMNECICSFIENLPVSYRTVVVLSEIEGLQNREIAQILWINLETVKIRLHRARAKLKKEMETHCSFYRDERNELACDLKAAFKGFRDAY